MNTEYPHQMVLLRSELVDIFYEHKYREHLVALSDKVTRSTVKVATVTITPPSPSFL